MAWCPPSAQSPDATARGYIVAYPDHLRWSIPVIQKSATIASLVAKKWCIDEDRVDLTGHSEGGMAADATTTGGSRPRNSSSSTDSPGPDR